MYETSLYSTWPPLDEDTMYGSCPSKVITGVGIDLFAVMPGCFELETMVVVSWTARHAGRARTRNDTLIDGHVGGLPLRPLVSPVTAVLYSMLFFLSFVSNLPVPQQHVSS